MALSVDLKGFPGATGAVVADGNQEGSWVCSNGWINATVDCIRKTFSGSDANDVASQIAAAGFPWVRTPDTQSDIRMVPAVRIGFRGHKRVRGLFPRAYVGIVGFAALLGVGAVA